MIKNQHSPHEVKARIQAAGRTLILLRMHGLRPRGHVSCWPDFARELLDTLDYNAEENTLTKIVEEEKPIWPTPTSCEIDGMDEALGWIAGLSLYCRVRKIPYVCKAVGYRMLHHPDLNGKKYSFKKIGERFPCKVPKETVRCWYNEGIKIIVEARSLAQAVENSSGQAGQK